MTTFRKTNVSVYTSSCPAGTVSLLVLFETHFGRWQFFNHRIPSGVRFNLFCQLALRRPLFFVVVIILLDFHYLHFGQTPVHFSELAQKFPENTTLCLLWQTDRVLRSPNVPTCLCKQVKALPELAHVRFRPSHRTHFGLVLLRFCLAEQPGLHS